MAVHSRYLDIAAEIRKRIEAGEWVPGDKLPRLDDFAAEFGANRDTVARAIGVLEAEGYVWAVQSRGITVRHGILRPRRPRGDLVKRNLAVGSPGYSFPSASGQERWYPHGESTNAPTPLTDPRIAGLLGVPVGTQVLHRFRVTGPADEAPFQTAASWIHPRVADLAADVSATPAAGEWLYRIEVGGHWPIEWIEYAQARMPTKEEAARLEIPTTLPVLEILRRGTSGTDGLPVEVTQYVIPGDRVELVHTLRRDPSATEPWPEITDSETTEATDDPDADR